jgi:two-component system, cell cycle response regulator
MMYGADDYISKPYDNSIFMARFKANARTYFLYKELERRAVTDGLTGLYNHRYIYDYVGTSIMEKEKLGCSFCVLLIDIDHFKSVNDTYGHQIGDLVLITLSNIFAVAFGDNAVCGRYGGEEFMAVLKNIKLDDALKVVNTFRETIMVTKYPDQEFTVTISGGLAEHNGSNTSAEIIKKADDLLYKAKGSGRNQICS